MEKVLSLLKQLIEGRYYADILIKIEAGRIVLIEKTEKIKP